ncbi:MAG: hypothetical protein SF162_08205 [bacterium]|nr:hypothetical protein [bacterium]
MPDLLDDLRKSDFDEPEADYAAGDEFPAAGDAPEKRFLGMTAVERMFLTMFVFLNVLVIGAALLLVTGRLVL